MNDKRETIRSFVISMGHGAAAQVWTLKGEAAAYTDTELLEALDWTPEFGGHVERLSNVVLATVYTD